MTPEYQKKLQTLALQIRIGTVSCIKSRGFGHIGGSLSVADVLAVLYGGLLRFDPARPDLPTRDKLVVSKGHAGPAVYAVLALRDFFSYDLLQTLNQPGTSLPSHCDHRKTPGVDMTTGSLGQGASLAVGMALGDRLLGRDCRTYLLVGDGELNEGQIWEAAMFTAAHKVHNVVWLIDWNKKQLDGTTEAVLDTLDLQAKFAAFGFDARTVDGHDVRQLHDALSRQTAGKPLAVILDTVKGKGVREVEEAAANHSMSVGPEIFDRWLDALRGALAALEALEAQEGERK